MSLIGNPDNYHPGSLGATAPFKCPDPNCTIPPDKHGGARNIHQNWDLEQAAKAAAEQQKRDDEARDAARRAARASVIAKLSPVLSTFDKDEKAWLLGLVDSAGHGIPSATENFSSVLREMGLS